MAIVSINRQYGAGGTLVGRLVANALNYRFVDKELLPMVAAKANVPLTWVDGVEREAGSIISRIISELVATDVRTRHVTGDSSKFNEDKFRDYLSRAVLELARADNVVFVGVGAHFILGNRPDTFHFLIVADEAERIASIMKRYGKDRRSAEKIAIETEKKRTAFLSGYEQGDGNDIHHYHLTLNTGRMTHEKAAEQICKMIREMLPRP